MGSMNDDCHYPINPLWNTMHGESKTEYSHFSLSNKTKDFYN